MTDTAMRVAVRVAAVLVVLAALAFIAFVALLIVAPTLLAP